MMPKPKLPPTEMAALERAIEALRQKIGARAAGDVLESFALDLSAEADRLEASEPPPA